MRINNLKIIIYDCSIVLLIIYGCSMMKNINNETSEAKYFTSPWEAVPVITDLMEKQDFKTLAAFYDLSSSKIKRNDLESGEFFIQSERPELAHPAEFWRYKHPFAPGFKFDSVQSTEEEGVYIVTVMIVIDQGEGSPPQEAFDNFHMIKSAKGWQILPNHN